MNIEVNRDELIEVMANEIAKFSLRFGAVTFFSGLILGTFLGWFFL